MLNEQLKELLCKICSLETAGYPIIEMEKVIEVGEPAVVNIVNCLKRERGYPYLEDDIPLLVMLGEIRSPKAIDILLRYIKDYKNDITAEVASEALAKIGKPAIPALKEIVFQEPNEIIRLYAYAALGYLRLPEASEILITRLENDKRLMSIIAFFLSGYKNKVDAERIYKAYTGLEENVFNPDIEESIWACANKADRLLPTNENWRIRYKRMPHYSWSPAVTTLGIMRISYSAVRNNRKGLVNYVNNVASGAVEFK